MNVIITNEQQSVVAGLDIDVIKSLHGQFDVDELISMFQNFYFGKMILDLTAIKDYKNLQNLQKLCMALDVDKIILLLPPNDPDSTSNSFLSQLISMGIYNFTTNLEGLKYLYEHPNTYKDVAHIHQLGQMQGQAMEQVASGGGGGLVILGVKNVTEHAGATTLIYMMKKALDQEGIATVAIELNKRDFPYFQEKNMISISAEQLPTELLKHRDSQVILVDLNDSNQDDTCGDIIYLLEPSILRLNKLMRRDRRAFEKLKGRKIVLCQSMLNSTDIADLEYESKSKIFFNLPPVNDRNKNKEIVNLLSALGILSRREDNHGEKGGGLFDFFRRND